jgi:phosphoribosyl-ATP pyrophosphohydrolase
MAKDRKAKKKKAHGSAAKAPAIPVDHMLDWLYAAINRRSANAPRSAKKLGEEAVEALIEGIRGDGAKLVGESADLLYHLLTLWAAVNVKPKAVWQELALREELSGPPSKTVRKR